MTGLVCGACSSAVDSLGPYGIAVLVIGVAEIIWLVKNTSGEAGMAGIERLRPGYKDEEEDETS